METKVCSRCGIEKEIGEFNKQKSGKNGRRSNCRECQKKEHAEYRHSEHGKKVRNAWKKTEKGRACSARYRNDPATKGKTYIYVRSDEYKYHKRISRDKDRFGGNRIKTLERDRYKCVFCGSTEYVQVHHKDETGRNKPKKIHNNDLDNLITLCGSCHIRQHPPNIKRWTRVRENAPFSIIGGDANAVRST